MSCNGNKKLYHVLKDVARSKSEGGETQCPDLLLGKEQPREGGGGAEDKVLSPTEDAERDKKGKILEGKLQEGHTGTQGHLMRGWKFENRDKEVLGMEGLLGALSGADHMGAAGSKESCRLSKRDPRDCTGHPRQRHSSVRGLPIQVL